MHPLVINIFKMLVILAIIVLNLIVMFDFVYESVLIFENYLFFLNNEIKKYIFTHMLIVLNTIINCIKAYGYIYFKKIVYD